MYLGEFAHTYIRPPQEQVAIPEKRWTVFRAIGFRPAKAASKIALQRSQSSSETTGSTCVHTYSVSGFKSQLFVRSFVCV
jgi:hypothetical protein